MTQEEIVNLNISCVCLPSECAQGIRISVNARLEDGQGFTEIGQTETISGSVNPTFMRTVPIIVRLDVNQQLKFIVYRVDPTTEAFVDKFGEAEASLASLITSPANVALPVRSPYLEESPHSPLLLVAASTVENALRGTVLVFAGNHLNPHTSFQVAPYFTIELVSSSPGKTSVLLYRSEIAHNSENPRWQEFVLPTSFFPSSAEWVLQISCFNFNINAEDTLMGRFTTTFYQLLGSQNANKFTLRSGSKKKENATMELVNIGSREDTPSFVNLLKSGLQMHFTVAIDFTANNGSLNSPNSLHHIHPHGSNVYMSALNSICSSILKFDKLDRISLLGFGAKVPPVSKLSQCFALNGEIDRPHVKGINEVMTCYRNNAISLLPYAPTEYSEVIHHVVKLAKASLRTSTGFYFTLIILTNGSIKNTQDTVDTIVQASELPMSIVFVALGNSENPIGHSGGDASKLLHLLSPSLKSSKNVALKRETVSLVVNNQDHCHPVADTASLAQKTLANIPRQVTLWKLKEKSNGSA